jgi:hypothetical protein
MGPGNDKPQCRWVVARPESPPGRGSVSLPRAQARPGRRGLVTSYKAKDMPGQLAFARRPKPGLLTGSEPVRSP